MASTTFDEELARVLAQITASGQGVETWVDPLLSLEARTPEEEEEKSGLLSSLGAILHEPKRRVDIALNYYSNPYLRNRVLSGGEPVPSGQLAKEAYIAPPDPTQGEAEQHLRAAGRGVMERWIDVSTDPVLFALPPVMRGAPAAVKVAAGLGFAGAMAKDMVHQADLTYESYKAEGWSPTTSEEAAKTAFDAGLLATMIPFRRGAKGEPRDVTPEDTALARPEPVPTRPVPPSPGIPRHIYEAYQQAWMDAQRKGLPPPPPPGGGPGEPTGPRPPGPPPTRPSAPRIPEVNIPETPERLADSALLGQLQAIRQAIQNRLAAGDIDGAQDLRRHYERIQDVYRTRRYTEEVRVGREGDMMQLRDMLENELAQGPTLARELEIREALSVLDAELDIARSARSVEAPPEAAPPPTPGTPPEAPPPTPGVPPAEGPPGPIPSRSPQVTPGDRGPTLEPSTPVEAAAQRQAATRQGVQELVEGAQAEVTGMPPPASSPLATVLEGGESAGQATRAGSQGPVEGVVLPPAVPPGAPPPVPSGGPPLPGSPGGPPLDVTLGTPPGPRLGPVAPIYPTPAPHIPPRVPTVPEEELPAVETPEEEAAATADAVDAFLREQGLAEAEAGGVPEEPAETPPSEPAPKVIVREAELTPTPAGIVVKPIEPEGEPTLAKPEPEAKEPEPPEGQGYVLPSFVGAPHAKQPGQEAYGMETFENPTKGLTKPGAAKKGQDISYVTFRGKNFWTNGHIVIPGKPPAGIEARDMTSLIEAMAKNSVSAKVDRWQRSATGKGTPVWLRGVDRKGKEVWAALDGDYFRTLNKIAEKNDGAQWHITPGRVGNTPQSVFLTNLVGSKILGMAAPLNESGPPPDFVEAPVTVEPTPGMRAAADQLEGELAGKPQKASAQTLREIRAASGAEEKSPIEVREVDGDIDRREWPEDLGDADIDTYPVADADLDSLPEGTEIDVVHYTKGEPDFKGRSAYSEPVEDVTLVKTAEGWQRKPEEVAPAAPAPVEEAPASGDIGTLEEQNASLKEARAQQLAEENDQLRAQLEDADAGEARGVGQASEEILPRPGVEAEGERDLPAAPEEPGGEVVERVPGGDSEGTERRTGTGAGEGRGVPEARAVPSVTPETPAGVDVEELRADGETRVVEPKPAPTPKPETHTHKWAPGELERTEKRGLKQKATDNLAAITFLKEIEAAGRTATAAEQEALAAYVGWGGMPRIFKDWDYGQDADWWQEKHKALVEALTPEEYEAAKASVTNAHYTRETVIRSIWHGLERWGGRRMMRVLEPSMGVGNFISAMPDALRPVHFTGIELDPVTGRIARQLFPNANVHVGGFEATPTPDNYFDVAISNVPFGNFGVADPRFRTETFLTNRIHNYFFAKALDKVRPGGVLAFITSHYTMDAKDTAFREYMAENAWFVGGVRLPRSTFVQNAATAVTADVLFFRKKIAGEEEPTWAIPPENWTHTKESGLTNDYGQTIKTPVSAYFMDNPGQVLGEFAVGDGTAGPDEITVEGDFDPVSMQRVLERMGADNLLERPAEKRPDPPIATAEEIRRLKPGNFQAREKGVWVYGQDGTFRESDLTGKAKKVAADWIPVRDAARDVITNQLERGSEADLKKAQKALNTAYDRFTKKHGPIHGLKGASRAINTDPDFPLTLALEEYTPARRKGRKIIAPAQSKKRDIFTKRTVSGYEKPAKAESTSDAYGISLAEYGHIDVDRIAGLLDVPPSEALGRLLAEGLAFEDPANGNDLQTAELYLSGPVVERLEQAKAAAELEPDRYGRNVEALTAVQPEPLAPNEITVQLGAPWVPPVIYEEFAAKVLGGVGDDYWRPGEHVAVRHSEGLGQYDVRWENSLEYSAEASSTYGTTDMNALELFEKGMNMAVPVVRKGSGEDRHVDPDSTALAQDKLQNIKDRFRTWVWEDPTRAERLLGIYNRQFNNQRLRTPDGSHLAFPGINRSVLRGGDLEPHQKNDVWRILTQPNTLIAEPVGSGKTWTLAAALMEARRTGRVRKPVLAVPNDIFEQWGKEWSKLYPHAKLLIVEPDSLRGPKRAETMSRIATEEWDGILVTHEALKSLPVSTKAVESVVREEIALLDQTIRELADDMGEGESIEDFVQAATEKKRGGYGRRRVSRADTRLVKQIEKQKARLKAKLKTLYEQAKRDKTIAFDELGVDMLLVDESHAFNNLYFSTKLGRVKGISNENADRAFDLYVKVKTLQAQQNGGGVVFATATPVRNTLAEIYTLFRYLDPGFLRDRGLRHFDDWARVFAEPRHSLALKPTGSGYRPETRFSAFVNVPELLTAFRNVTAVMTAEDLNLPVPLIAENSKGERRPNFIEVAPTDTLRDFVESLNARADAIKNKLVEPEEDNMLLVTTDGRKAALDLAMVGAATEPTPGQKLDTVRQRVYDIWKKTKGSRGVQAVFLDLSTPQAQPFSAYRWLKDAWVKQGIPAEEIEFVHDYDRKTKPILFEKLNRSEARIVIGSTKKMGIGANFQRNLVALHNVDVPWTPDGYEQRNGRGIRQGNKNDEVSIDNYVTQGTFDAYMWQLISTKAGFIGQVMTGKASARTMEDVSLTYLTAQEALAASSENPLVVQKITLEADLRKYERLLGAHQLETYQAAQRKAKWEGEIRFHKDRAKEILDVVSQIQEDSPLELFAEPGLDPNAKAANVHKKRTDEAGEQLKGLLESVPLDTHQFVGRYKGFPIMVNRRHGAQVTFIDVVLAKPTAAGGEARSVFLSSVWRPHWQGSGTGLIQSMDSRMPTEAEAKSQAAMAVRRENEIKKLATPEFAYAKELAETEKALADVNAELKTQDDDSAANQSESEEGADDGGDYAEDADYEAGETGVAPPERVAPDEAPPPAAGGGAGGRRPPGGRPPDDATPDGLPSEGPQPGEDGWQRRVNEAKARNRKRNRGGQTNAGVDPMHMADIAIEGADLVARGFRRFGRWSREMLRTLGQLIPGLRGMLRGIWNWVKQMFRSAGRGPNEGERRRRQRPGFEEYRTEFEEGQAGQPGAGRRRYPWEEREIPPEEVRAAAEEGGRYSEAPPPEYGKPPKADINFDRIGGEPDIRAWQAKVVESLRPRWGKIRSFRSWAEARDYAVRAGLTQQDFIRLVKERGVVTDIEIEAGRMMRQEGAEAAFAKLNRLKELQERRRQTTDDAMKRRLDEEIIEADREYRDALARYSAVTAATVEAAAELGRALNIHRKMAEAISPEESFFRQLLRKHPGMSERMQQELADAVMQKDAVKLRDLARKLYKPGVIEYASEWFINALLSGLTTLEVNVLGNLSFEAMFRTPERGLAAGLESIGARQMIEKMFGRDPLPRQRFGREFEEALRRHIEIRFGMPRALKHAWEFLVNEPAGEWVKGEFKSHAWPGWPGKVIRTPQRMMYALDLGSRWAAMEAELVVQSVRRALMESRKAGGWTKDQVSAKMREYQEGYRRYTQLESRRRGGEVLSKEDYAFLAKNGVYGRWQKPIREAGSKATFTDRSDRFTAALMQMREAHPWLTFFAPFIKTPSRLLAAALERSPWGAYDMFRKAKTGELRGGELSDQMARVVYGNLIGASLYLLARQGLVSGSGPADPRERAQLRKTGWEPYSIKLGNTWVSFARLEPFGTHLGWAADLAEAQDVRGAGELYDKLIQGISLNIVNKTYLQGPIGVAEALGDPERYGSSLGRKTLGAFVPNILAQAARAIDPYVRETDTISGTLLSRIPIASMSLPPRRGGTGEIMVREEHPLSRWLNPFRYSVEKGPEANLERVFLDVGYIPSNAPRKLTVPGTGGRKVALTSDERQLYSLFKERATRFARSLAQREDFLALEPWQKEELLKRIYRYAHDSAHRAMVAAVARRAPAVEWVD